MLLRWRRNHAAHAFITQARCIFKAALAGVGGFFMAISVGRRAFKVGERLHAPLLGFFTTSSAYAYAFNWMHGAVYTPNKPGNVLVQFERSKLTMISAASGWLEAGLNRMVAEFEIEIVEAFSAPGPASEYSGNPVIDMMTNMTLPIFTSHYDACYQWLRANKMTNTESWPMTVDFARLIRNAASHGGRVDQRNSTYRTLQWKDLSYSAADHGRVILGREIFLGDLLSLMIELDDELVALGAPR